MRVQQTKNRGRTAFTLVELLVVVAIIAFLAALLVGFLPAVYSQNAESQGAVNLQGWLNIARQKAIRNQNPYGLRLWVNSQNLNTLQVVECQYIEQPDDFTSQTATISALTPPYNTVTFNGLDLTGGMPNSSLYPVQPRDYLEVLGTGLMHQVTGVANQQTLTIATPIPFPLNAATNFRILRQARVIGSETLPLPDGVIVDLQTNTTYNNPLPTFQWVPQPPPNATGAYVDVLFSPAGSLLGVSQGYLALWVRQPDLSAVGSPANVFSGSPTIIAVFAQTGLVGAYPPIATNANPYVDIH